ncbi:DUF6392 family protein [Photorhabdus khanii]|uniref:Immunity protein n=1 Tax=Photorhabdus khanii subsp. guanajuatensis TaxID=2100166 RepID=A0A4R4K5N9_9GAMM|nr:DUF6392 family protein [Photorhabdus khanii]TDB62680.1 immunity protein [Photorhabdus khanii subsp. guanajuatensis]
MTDITKLVQYLGETAEALVGNGEIPKGIFKFHFEGDESFNCELEKGITLVFDSESRRLNSIQLILIDIHGDYDEYNGDLPPPFLPSMDKATVRAEYGEPTATKDMIKAPVIGVIGGYDSYINRIKFYPNVEVIFIYDAYYRVRALTFNSI